MKLGDIGPDQGLLVDIQYAEGFVSGIPHLTQPFSPISVQLEDMETTLAKAPKAFGIEVVLDKLKKIDEDASYQDLEEVKDWFTSGHAADLKDVKVELNNATMFLDVDWENNYSDTVWPIDHYSFGAYQEQSFTPKVSEAPPPNTAFTLNSKVGSWLVVSLGKGSIGDEGIYIKPDLGYIFWAPELRTFLVIYDYFDMSGETEPYLPADKRVGIIEPSIHDEASKKVEIKFSVLKLDLSTANTNQATLEVLTDEGYELTVADMEGGRMCKVASTR